MKPILSLCIPIYNRLAYLERQLNRMLEDKELFKEQIQLIISDNCSTDDLQSCCEKYQKQGLNLTYHCNESNLGPDGNFDWCFHHAEGRYVWLLGSDDIPVKGVLWQILEILKDGDYGLVHLSTSPRNERLRLYHNNNGILADINVWITFVSSNIIGTHSVQNYDLKDYLGSYMIQVPAYLNACLATEDNALVYLGQLFEEGSDAVNNGGYNLFKVFVDNLFKMYQQFVDKGMLSQKTFELIKEREYKSWLIGVVVDMLILKRTRRRNFDQTDAWSVLRKHYGGYMYFYYTTIILTIKSVSSTVVRAMYHMINNKTS